MPTSSVNLTSPLALGETNTITGSGARAAACAARARAHGRAVIQIPNVVLAPALVLAHVTVERGQQEPATEPHSLPVPAHRCKLLLMKKAAEGKLLVQDVKLRSDDLHRTHLQWAV
ncbi:hypothetical protein FA95DRAFT_642008 [Auriscalpium vulgare]|uniref:Uncharacterized protein n=1 Tax=Auriscalpium vulgare TaxID=40419 RepID=A0ACB8S359_9AGAM|nr:hypothetical protein FA95DRAFT_642008 [Auriscalpium vulgare]